MVIDEKLTETQGHFLVIWTGKQWSDDTSELLYGWYSGQASLSNCREISRSQLTHDQQQSCWQFITACSCFSLPWRSLHRQSVIDYTAAYNYKACTFHFIKAKSNRRQSQDFVKCVFVTSIRLKSLQSWYKAFCVITAITKRIKSLL